MAEIETKIETCPWGVPDCPAKLPETCERCAKGVSPLLPPDIAIAEYIKTRYENPQPKPEEPRQDLPQKNS